MIGKSAMIFPEDARQRIDEPGSRIGFIFKDDGYSPLYSDHFMTKLERTTWKITSTSESPCPAQCKAVYNRMKSRQLTRQTKMIKSTIEEGINLLQGVISSLKSQEHSFHKEVSKIALFVDMVAKVTKVMLDDEQVPKEILRSLGKVQGMIGLIIF